MLKRLLFTLIITLSALSVFAQSGTGTLKGSVLEESNGETIPFANVALMQGERVISGTSTDFDGVFQLTNIPPGSYDVRFSFIGYNTVVKAGVVINSDKITFLDKITMAEQANEIDAVVITSYSVPLIDKDGGPSGGVLTKEEIQNLPTRDIGQMVAQTAGVAQGEDGSLNSRGARGNSNVTFVDGMKVIGAVNIPKGAIQEVSVIVGGTPANYGDAVGAVTSITTAGVSDQFHGGVEVVSSGFKIGDEVVGLDKYGYNLVEGSFMGPLMFRKDTAGNKKEAILGFMLSGNVTHSVDGSPVFGGTYYITDEAKQRLLSAPLTRDGGTTLYNSDYVTEDDFYLSKTRQNAQGYNASLATKIDYKVNDNATLSLSSQGSYSNGSAYDYGSSVFNSDNFGEGVNYTWRAGLRYSQRFNADPKTQKNKAFRGASYNLLVDYNQTGSSTQDPTFKDDIFGYGYLGKYETVRERSYEQATDDAGTPIPNQFIQNGWNDVSVRYTPSDLNRELAAQSIQYWDLYGENGVVNQNYDQIQQNNGLLNGGGPASVYGIWGNIGPRYGSYGKTNANQIRLSGNGSVSLGDHRISLGFEYEKRKSMSHSVSAPGLWFLGRQLMNNQINELDYDNIENIYTEGTNTYIDYARLYAPNSQFRFDKSVREALGLAIDSQDYIDIDALDPEFFSLGMFSAEDLQNSGSPYVSYAGYDYKGDKVGKNYTFDDFFTALDDRGDLLRPVKAFEPIYVAGYLMDKFSYEDVVFNVGVRVDRYDANQPVLKDPYLLANPIYAGDYDGSLGDLPSNVGTDYVIYVDDVLNPTAITGYRNGDTWYNADGAEVNDPRTIAGTSGIAPLLQDPYELGWSQATASVSEYNTLPTYEKERYTAIVDETSGSITGYERQATYTRRVESSKAFEDYKPDINVSPRIAFSFPISDKASFNAHYDILTQRPSSNNVFNPYAYRYLAEQGGVISNPNLKAEKTIDYEFGFQQVLSRSSSIKIAAFYREQRDQVQAIQYNQAYPVSYVTYGNVDFGTVKGMSLSYDLRRTNNLMIKANYTLQFADGTGSGASDGINLAASGQPNLRTIFPYSYDQRHTLSVITDYRFGEGARYNGPISKAGAQILKNTGINLLATAGSGRPYSRRSLATPTGTTGGSSPLEGTKNGSRLPWRYKLDLKIDRNIMIETGKQNKRQLYVNVYFWVQNLLNTQNIVGVYAYTGSPDDDGYLAAQQFQQDIANKTNEESFRYLYQMKVDNPYNYGAPRTLRIGASLNF